MNLNCYLTPGKKCKINQRPNTKPQIKRLPEAKRGKHLYGIRVGKDTNRINYKRVNFTSLKENILLTRRCH